MFSPVYLSSCHLIPHLPFPSLCPPFLPASFNKPPLLFTDLAILVEVTHSGHS